MKPSRKWLILAAVVVLAGLALLLNLHRGTQPQYFTAAIERGDIYDVVDATGTINAVTTVQVGSQVSGAIAKLNADFNSRVHKGDIIALIDPALFRGALLQASADLDNAKANVLAAKANLEKSNATLLQTKADYERTVPLTKLKMISEQQLDLTKANYDSASAAVDAAAANVTQAEAQVRQKAAALAVAQTNLDYTVIRSPIDGTVVARNVELGQTVAASLQAPTIFTIAQDLTKMLVYTKTDESDVGSVRPGTAVTFKVDAFPKDTFRGAVSQVRMNPTTVQNVVTYDTIVEFANPDLKLFPGMTAYVSIPVATVHNVLKLPNTALRYKPPMSPEEVLALYQRAGIEVSERQSGKGPASAPAPAAAVTAETQISPRTPKPDSAVVWKLQADNSVAPVQVQLGITDHAFTEVPAVLKGELHDGDAVVIRAILPQNQTPGGLPR
jgi:HlyD family secretion protein